MRGAAYCLFGVAIGAAVVVALAMKLGKKHKGAEYPRSEATH